MRYHFYLYGGPRGFILVAATDLFPFANQCPCKENRSLTDQSTGRAH